MSFKIRALQTLWWLSSPFLLLCLPQAIYVKKTALRLPEAQGDREFTIGRTESSLLHLVHFGESTVAGVGVDQVSQGFTHHLAKSLIKLELSAQLSCKVVGENGIRFEALNQHINRFNEYIDIAVITMGVNDTTGLSSLKTWRENLQLAIHTLQSKGAKQIFFSHVPPMAQFPALPKPLRYLLGLRATLLNTQLEAICRELSNVHYLHSELDVESEYMARDGYHPSELGYQEWAKQIAPQMLEHLQQSPTANT